jgi:Holliday junction DNA helicase RuvA
LIAKLTGRIEARGTNWLILDVHDVGYKVFVGEKMLIHSPGQDLIVFTHQYLRENIQELYGFETLDELKMFETLISVSGVGPKGALGILSHSTPQKIIDAISQENTTIFTIVSGIGKKLAAKIILELKTKLTGAELGDVLPSGMDEAGEALIGLGYARSEIAKVLADIPSNIKDPGEQASWALKRLGQNK